MNGSGLKAQVADTSGVLIPLSLAAYVSLASGFGMDHLGALDTMVYVLSFYLLFETLSLLPGLHLRRLATVTLVFINILLLWGSLLYLRHFQSYPPLSVFMNLDGAPIAAQGVPPLLKPLDFALFLALPALLLLPGFGRKASSASLRKALPLALLIALALIVHWFQHTNYTFADKQVNPVINLPRQAAADYLLSSMSEQIRSTAGGLYNEDGLYSSAGNAKYPFLKTPVGNIPHLVDWEGRQPNVVLIVLESFQASESGAYNYGRQSYTPEFDKLAADSLVFRNIYSSGFITASGEFSILSSFYPRFSLISAYMKNPYLRVQTLPSVLSDRGYDAAWLSGPTLEDMERPRKFYSTHGFRHHFQNPEVKVGYVAIGPSDEDLYAYALKVFTQLRAPFYVQIATLSSHTSFTRKFPEAFRKSTSIPPAEGDERYKGYTAGYYYADYALGKFFEAVKDKPYFKDTIFVITSDHGAYVISSEQDTNPIKRFEWGRRIPLLIYSPALLEPSIINTEGSQIDVTPTVLDLLGIRLPNSFAGSSLLRPARPGQQRMVAMGTNEGDAAIRLGNKYCYFRKPLSHHTDPLPASGNDTHVCFSYEGDLLNMKGTEGLKALPESQSDELLKLNSYMKGISQHLIEADQIWPGPGTGSDAAAR